MNRFALNRWAVLAAFGLTAMTGCSKETEEQATPAATQVAPAETTAAAAPVETAPPAAPQADQNDGLELEQDLEDKASDEITSQNLDAELDKVEKEIASGK